MKRLAYLFSLATAAVILSLALTTGCEGPAGPAGAAGAAGENGIDGENGADGTAGVAGNEVCLTCHNLAVKDAIETQYLTSLHATSQTFYPGSPTTVSYAGGRKDCARCHSTEGFIETLWTGLDTTANDIPLPQGLRCATCHDFHSSLDFENEPNHAIRTTSAVTLIADGSKIVEFENEESNLCMNCHQARTNPADDADGAAMVYIEEHYGPHHAPQANFINGLGGYEFGALLSTSGSHESLSSCVDCHMHEGGTETGGHTWAPGIESCTSCHDGATDFDINGEVTVIEGLMDDLTAALITAGMLDAEGHAIEDVSHQADSVGALWNLLLLEEDKSIGIHNPAYAKALLNNSLNALN
jgi:hypothetical protein